ncbi:MAG: HD domain-containing protein, partial [Moheibacter sp.]
MNQSEIVELVKQFIQTEFSGEGTGHDYFHVERVVKVAKRIAEEEKADVFLVELAAWLHDVGDYKLNDGIDKSEELISAILIDLNVSNEIITRIIDIISQVSFSKGKVAESLEAKIVQDADRLDAIGAIGIARVFA